MKPIIVVLMLFFSDGSVFQDFPYKRVDTVAECTQLVNNWRNEMREKYKDQSDPFPTTFLTGCVKDNGEPQ